MEDDSNRPAVLLLSRDEASMEMVRNELAALPGVRLLTAAAAREAVALLCRGEQFSALVIHPSATDGLLADLIGLTVDEVESGVSMVLLGEPCPLAQPLHEEGRATVVRDQAPGWLPAALAAVTPGNRPWAALPLDDLLAAIAADRLQMRYQPVVRLEDGAPFALEALARLHHPRLGTLPPERFVPPIEAAGHAPVLAEAVVRRAFREWSGDALSRLGLRLAVNLPLQVLMLPGEVDRLELWRQQAGIDPGRITVELTETTVPSPETLRPALERLRDAGYRLAIDDVGPDSGDYEALFGLPFTSVKLDKEVVQASAASAAALHFIEEAIAAARRAGLLVVAEGVETPDDWARMRRAGVDLAQGFLIGRPLTAVAVAIWHADWSRRQAP
jgi:EAL domain-containing protein (putative c-di-GMP-specific phosphodiesterase class I)